MNKVGISKLYLGISGMIGAGKTLANELGKVMGLPVFLEIVEDNTYYDDFFKDPKKFGFPLQICNLNNRYEQQQKIVWEGKGGIQDRTIYEDLVFCTMQWSDGIIKQRDYETYQRLFQNLSKFMERPNIIIHLDVSPEESYKRIQMRNRDFESAITMEFLKKLHNHYKDFIKWISQEIPVIVVDYSKFRKATDIFKMVKEKWESNKTIFQMSV